MIERGVRGQRVLHAGRVHALQLVGAIDELDTRLLRE